jgi:hypothetical protein
MVQHHVQDDAYTRLMQGLDHIPEGAAGILPSGAVAGVR